MENKKNAGELISEIIEKWFLTEPLLFNIYCTHKLCENSSMKIPFRCGKRRIEFNPTLLQNATEEFIEDYLKVEVIRILLKHPYQRMPSCPNLPVLAIASDITLQDNLTTSIPLAKPEDFDLPKSLCYEEYYARLLEKLKNELNNFAKMMMDESSDNDAGDKNKYQNLSEEMFSNLLKNYQTAELWSEDQETAEIINSEIEKAQSSNSWGTIGGNLQQLIEASLIIQMDYRRMLSMFRASILSSERRLTRMKPNRRYGLSYMGSKQDFTTGLLIATDVSGSVSDESLQKFFSIINRFFKYGIKTIDVIQFDAELKDEVLSLKKAKKTVKIKGRGGTIFQPVIDYYEQHPMYDGLIVFTDGYAEIPKLHRYSERILWVLTSKSEYDNFCATMLNNLPGSKATYIP